MNRFALFIATCGYVGYAPVAPGTFGSGVGLGLLWVVRTAGPGGLEFLVILGLVGLGTWSSSVVERQTRSVDPGIVVIDEAAGMLITLALVPLTAGTAVAGFVLFRALDILKPWPIRCLERIQGGAGVMADDVMAAVYGNVVLHALLLAWPAWLT